jgi:flagellar hook-basal body complex protein FliE
MDPINSIGMAASQGMAPDLASRMADGVQVSGPVQLAGPAQMEGVGHGGGFEGILDTINRAEQAQQQSSALTQAFSQGQDVPIHQVMAAAEEAQLTLETLTALRNKALDSFNELMRLQV